MAQTTNKRPDWVTPGQQWFVGETLEQYKEAGKPVSPSYGTPVTTTKPTLESIAAGIAGVAAKIPAIKAGVTALTQAGQKEIDTSQAPALPTVAGDVVAAGNGAITAGTSTLDDFQKRLTALENIKPSPEVVAEKKSIMDLITKRETTKVAQKSAVELRQEALTQAYQEMGVTPEQIQTIGSLIGQITTFNQQIADIEARKQTALDAAETRGMSAGYIAGEQNRLTKQYNSEISAKGVQAAVKVQELQMIQGAYTDAKATAAQIVNLSTYDQQQEVADIEWSLAAHQDLYNLLSGEEQTAWNRQYTIAKDELNRLTTEKTNVNDLMLKYPKAGILITDTQDEATEKATKWQAIQPEAVKAPTIQNFGTTAAPNWKQWDTITGTWKPVTGIPTGAGVTSDLSNISNLQTFKDTGGLREDAKAIMDKTTSYNVSTIDSMLDKVYGIAKPATVSGMKQWVKEQLAGLSKKDVNKEEAKQVIIENGFDPNDDEWDTFLKLFPSKPTWYKPWTWFGGKETTTSPGIPSETAVSTPAVIK